MKRLVITILLIILVASLIIPEVNASTNVLKTIYANGVSGFKTVVFYYGWLTSFPTTGLHIDILVVSGSTRILPGGNDYSIVQDLRNRGVEVYAYLHDGDTPYAMGSSFRVMVYENNTGSLSDRVEYWINYTEKIVDQYVGVVDGVFLDECDPSYFGITDPDNEYLQEFTNGLITIIKYAKNKGLKVFINGVRAYAAYGDYYLWEDFVSIYNETSSTYTLDKNFFKTSSDNPYDWVNGIAKYEYLRENNLLSKTIALSFADRNTLELAKYGYYMARILGLAGWAFAPIDIYASGGPIYTINVYEVGEPVSPPTLNPTTMTASRIFTSGEVKVDLLNEEIVTPFNYKTLTIDCKPLEYNLNTTTITGIYTTIHSYGYLAANTRLQVFVNVSWTQPSTGGLIHIYIDSDGNSSTGYAINGIGADYLVEIQASGYSELAEYNGTGSDWSWNSIGSIDKCIENKTTYILFEIGIPSNIINTSSRFLIATMYGWDDDAYIGPLTINSIYYLVPTIYDEVETTPQYAVIKEIKIEDTLTIIIADAPHGVYANYTLILPYDKIYMIVKNSTVLERKDKPNFAGEGYYVEPYGSYVRVIIIVQHASPVMIKIYQSMPPLDEPLILPLILVSIMLLVIYIYNRKK